MEKSYNVGAHCYKRTELYHRLHHYKYHLMERIKVIFNSSPPTLNFYPCQTILILPKKKLDKLKKENYDDLDEASVCHTMLDDELWLRTVCMFGFLCTDDLRCIMILTR
jgi:hypothetical protein